MAGQNSNDRIAELLKQACPPAAASPEFKAQLRQSLNEQAAALGTQSPKPLWQQPFLWIPVAAAAAAAVVLLIYFVAFHSVPLTVTTSDATGIQTTTATLNGNLDSLSAADNVQVSFEWGTGKDYGHETAPEVRTAAGSFTATLSGLSPNTTYHFRVKAVGRHGTVYGPDMQFTTGPAPPVAITKDAIKIKTESATLRGSLDDLGSAASVSVSFEWGLTASYGNETTPESKTETGKYWADLSELVPNTTYHFRAKAVGDDIAYGADAQFTTDTAPPSVETDNATNINTNSARLNGELASLGTASSVNVSFEYGAATGSYAQTTADQAMLSTGAFSADLSGLAPGATYYYRAKADGDGHALYGDEKSFTTLTVPPLVTTCSATEVHSESATLNGILNSLGTAASAEVSFEWGLTTAYGNETAFLASTAIGSFDAKLTELDPRTTYHFRAKAVGDGVAYGDDMTFTTGNVQPAQKTWYLSGDTSGMPRIMYDGDTSKQTGTVTLGLGAASYTQIWIADQPSLVDTQYASGNWTVQLTLSHVKAGHIMNVEIGAWMADVFTPYGVHTFEGEGDDNDVTYTYRVDFPVASFDLPSGGYVATRVTMANKHMVCVHVGGSQGYVKSPSYPEPTAPTVTTNAAASVEQTAVTLNGYLDSSGTASRVVVYFEWGTTTEYGNEIKVADQTSSGGFSALLADLAPSTTYHYRAKAVGDGTNYGVDVTFTTPP